jgi:hypothetical protein
MSEDKFGALVPEMNLSVPAMRFQATRLSLDADTFGGRARPSCHVSYYRRVLILP